MWSRQGSRGGRGRGSLSTESPVFEHVTEHEAVHELVHETEQSAQLNEPPNLDIEEWLEENFTLTPSFQSSSSSVDLLTAQVNRLSVSPEIQAPVLIRARGRPPPSDVEKERRRLAIEEGEAAWKADKELARQNKKTKNS